MEKTLFNKQYWENWTATCERMKQNIFKVAWRGVFCVFITNKFFCSNSVKHVIGNLRNANQNYSVVYHLIPVKRPSSKNLQTINAGEDVEKRTLLHCQWECKLIKPLWRTVWVFLKKKLETELPYDPGTPLPEKTIILKDMCSLMFIAALFAIARTWKQSICPPT